MADEARVRAILRCAGAALALCIGFPDAARAQDAASFPQKTIRIVVPFAAGGGTDILARQIAAEMSKDWNVPVVVDNRPGGATVAGTEQVARAAPDGATLLLTANPFSVNPSLIKQLPYESLKDFAPVTRVAISPLLLVVHPSVPATTAAELIALAKSKPGTLNYASSGVAGPEHLAGAVLASMTGADMVHIPFKGSGPAIVALLGGQIQMSFTSTISALPQVKAGQLRALAVSSAKRSPALPEVPSIAELPGLGDYEVITWYGVLVPAATSPPIIAKLQAEIARAMETPAIRARLAESGTIPTIDTPDGFRTFLEREIARSADVIAKAGIRPE